MVKKVGGKKKSPRKRSVSKKQESKTEKLLVENFVSLQKVMADLSIKFDGLSNNISQLLDLFETSAKALAKKDFSLEPDVESNKEILNKIDNLFEQNKIIARGLSLIHEKQGLSQSSPQGFPEEEFKKSLASQRRFPPLPKK